MDSETNSPAYHARLLQEQDASSVRLLFKQVFGQDMSQEFWEWKYGADKGLATGVFVDNKLIAHYGGMSKKVLWNGKECMAVQIADVMVAEEGRQSVRSSSPFYKAFTLFAESFLGNGKKFPIAFGFPSKRVMKLAQLLNFYAPVGEVVQLTWPARASLLNIFIRQIDINKNNVGEHQAEIDKLWAEMSHDLKASIAGIRSGSYALKRYLNHPVRSYQLSLIRSRLGNFPLGFIVLRHDEDESMLMDVIGKLKHFPSLLRVAAQQAHQQGSATLMTWCSTAFLKVFHHGAWSQQDIEISVPANVWTQGPAPSELQDRWWLMPGDTDFQ